MPLLLVRLERSDDPYIAVPTSLDEAVSLFARRVHSDLGLPPAALRSLRLLHVPHAGALRPAAGEEAAAVLLEEPAQTLRAAGVGDGAWILARCPPAPVADARGAAVFAADVELLENTLRRILTPLQREAFSAREFDYARVALREGRFDCSRASGALLLAQLDGRVRTTTQRRLSTTVGGLYLDGLLAGGDMRGRAADIFCAVRVADGAVGAAKLFYAAPLSTFDDAPTATADGEWRTSQLLDATAAADHGLARARVVRYSERVDLGRGRTALFMPLFVRSLHQLVHGSHVAAPLPAAFLLRTAGDVLRGLALLHAAGLAHCDVKADNVMFDGAGAATLIDLGAATSLGEATREGAPESAALGLDVSVAGVAVDLACLASALWWAAQRTEPPSGCTPATLAELAERLAAAGAGEPLVLRAVAVILRAGCATRALEALGGAQG